jgi:hypothetical protein
MYKLGNIQTGEYTSREIYKPGNIQTGKYTNWEIYELGNILIVKKKKKKKNREYTNRENTNRKNMNQEMYNLVGLYIKEKIDQNNNIEKTELKKEPENYKLWKYFSIFQILL